MRGKSKAEIREALARAVHGSSSVQHGEFSGRNALKQTEASFAAEIYFQKAALGMADFNNVYGSQDEFMESYKKFSDTYYAALRDKNNIGKLKKVNANALEKQGIIDLNLLVKSKSDELHEMFMRDVVRVGDLVSKAGLPATIMPNSNLYSESFRYLIDPRENMATSLNTHPAQILLNRSNFRFNPRMQDLDALSVGRGNILSFKAMQEVYSRAGKGLTSNLAAGARVMTFDVETTGISDSDVVRSFSAVESVMEEYKDPKGASKLRLSKPVERFNEFFDAPQMGGIQVETLSGRSRSLSQFASEAENLGKGSKQMDEFLTESVKFLERVMETDKSGNYVISNLMGHNVHFDIKKLISTMESSSNYRFDTRAQGLVGQLRDRMDGGGFIVDTLDDVRSYFDRQATMTVGETFKSMPFINHDSANDVYVNSLFSPSVLARVHVGGSAAPFSMENIALNSNLLELIERDGGGEQIYDFLSQGSHVAKTDAFLQQYVVNYMNTGELKTWAYQNSFPDVSNLVETPFGRFERSRILQSQAITSTTNMADVQNISAHNFKYLLSNEGMKGVSLNVQNAASIGYANESGTLVSSDGTFKFLTSNGGMQPISNQAAARSLIEQTLKESANPTQMTNLSIQGKVVGQFSEAQVSINDLGFSFKTASSADEIGRIGRLTVASDPSAQAVMDLLGSVYSTYGSGLEGSQQIQASLFINPAQNVFSRIIPDTTPSVQKAMAEKFAAAGDPFYFLDKHSRILSTSIAQATASIGSKAGRLPLRAGYVPADIAFTDAPEMMSELGISYFNAQKKASIFSTLAKTDGEISKIITPHALLEKALENAGVNQVPNRLGLSVAQIGNDKDQVNLVWDMGRQLGRRDTKKVTGAMLDILSDPSQVASILGDSMDETVLKEMNYAAVASVSAEERDRILAKAVDTIMRTGVVIGNAGKESENVINALEALGYDSRNDAFFRQYTASVQVTGLNQEAIAVSPFSDQKALQMRNATNRVDEANEVILGSNGQRSSRLINAANKIAGPLDDNKNIIRKNIKQAKSGLSSSPLAELYTKNKKNIAVGALAIASLGVGYYMHEKNEERQLYDETIAPQPTQGRAVQIAPFNNSYSLNGSRRTQVPLSTAGVVGNLDRQKIGHHQMGNNKYNHLYGG